MLSIRLLSSLLVALLACISIVSLGAQDPCTATEWRCVGTGQEYTTIQAALDDAIAGDTVFVKAAGSPYVGAHIVGMGGGGTHVSGTANAPITIKAESLSVVINTADPVSLKGLSTDFVDYVTIDGFTITVASASSNSIKVTNCDGCKILNNDASGSSASCILTGYAYGVLIQGNKTHGCGYTGSQHGIYVSNSARGLDAPIVRQNESYSNFGAPLQINGGCPALSPNPGDDGIINAPLVERNLFHDGPGMSIINTYDGIFKNNIIYNISSSSGIKLADDGDCGVGAKRNVIKNNTFQASAGQACVRVVNTATNISITGNIIFNGICVSTGFDCVIDLDASTCGNGTDPGHNFFAASLKRSQAQVATGYFTNYAARDFTLVSGSPAISAGTSTFNGQFMPVTDYLNNWRVVGQVDDGAYEFGASAIAPDTTAPTAPGSLAATVNPSQVVLTWTGSTEARELLWYFIYRNGSPYAVASSATLTYTDTAISAGATYTYNVIAEDWAINLSASSNTVSSTIPGITGCMNADTTFNTAGRYRLLPELTGVHKIEFDATPFVDSSNSGVMGLSKVVPAGYASFATIVRFANGVLDARNGAAYTADAVIPFSLAAGAYHIREQIDITNHIYTVFVTPPGGSELLLANNYAFRSEQAAATSLGYIGVSDELGSLSVCTVKIDDELLDSLVYATVTPAITGVSSILAHTGTGRPVMDHSTPIVNTDNSITLTAAMCGNKIVKLTSSTPVTITIPAGITELNLSCTFVQANTGKITVTKASGVTLYQSADKYTSRGRGSPITIQNLGTADEFFLWGDLQ